MIKALFACLALSLSPLPTLAACVTADSLTTGVIFTRMDGRTGLAKRTVNSVLVDYDTGKTEWDDRREGSFGIYESSITQYFSDEMLVGSGSTDIEWSFGNKPPRPEAGTSFKTNLRGTWTEYDSTEKGYSKGTYAVRVEYRFLEEKEVKLSGCTYTIIPVEATFSGKGPTKTQRWVYFKDLYFGLETTLNGDKRGLTMMKPL